MSSRAWTLIGFAILVIGAAVASLDLRVEFDVHRVLNPNELELEKVQNTYDELPWDKTDVHVALTFERRIEANDLEVVTRVANRLEVDPRVASVIALDRVSVVDPQRLVPLPFPQTIGDRGVYESAWSHPLLRGTLISRDGRSTLVSVRATRDATDQFDAKGLIAWLETEVPRLVGNGAEVRVIGSSVVLQALHDRLRSGIAIVLGLEVLLFSVLLPLLFRTVRGSVMPIAVVLVAVLFNFAWMALFDYPLTVVDVAIPGLVVIIGLCDVIHLMQAFEENYAKTGERDQAIRHMMRSVGNACFYTSFTTGVGFLSLIATDHDAVSTFGIKAAISVVVTFLVVILLVPALLQVLPLGPPRPSDRVLWTRLGYGRRGFVLTLTAIGLAFIWFGSTRVVADSHLLEELPNGDAIARDIAWFDSNFSGIIDVETRVRGDLEDPVHFAALERFEREMMREDGVTRLESVTLFVREAIGNPKGRLDAAKLRTAFSRLRLARRYLPQHLVDEDFGLARVIFKTLDVGSTRMLALRTRIETLARDMPAGLIVEPSGYVMMASASTKLVVGAISQSLILSMFVIAFFLAALFRSFSLALVALLTNVLPLGFALGLSGWLGIELTIGSALIYCLGLGLAVDDSIHILARYRHEKREHPHDSPREQLTRALQSSGKALITTSLVLGVGALCHLAADFQSLRNVGVLLTTVIVVALLVDLWLLPICVEWLESRGTGREAASVRSNQAG